MKPDKPTPVTKDSSLRVKIRMLFEEQNSWSASQALKELRKRGLVNDWCTVIDVADELKEMYN